MVPGCLMQLFVHPFLNLPLETVRRWSKILVIAFLVTTVILGTVVPAEHRSAIANFVLADAALAPAELSRWDSATRESFQFVLGFDFLYDLVHNNLVAMLLAWGAILSAQRWALQLASAFAWILWMDTALNLLEHFIYRHLLATGILEPWHSYGMAIFNFRTSTLVAGALIAAVIHISVFYKRWSS